jgi:hypothetical protein
MVSSVKLRRVALVGTEGAEDRSASIRVTRIGELGITLGVNSNRNTLQPEHRFSQEPHGVRSQKTPFFKITAVKTSTLTSKEVIVC